MDYKRDAFLVIDPVTGATKLVERPGRTGTNCEKLFEASQETAQFALGNGSACL